MEIIEIENRRTIGKITDPKSQYFEKIKKSNKSLAVPVILKSRRLKLLESKMKEETLLPTFQK